jgi:hypothetical protein
MKDPDPTDASSEENGPKERVRERLSEDDTTSEPVSEEALVDADAIGSGLREER